MSNLPVLTSLVTCSDKGYEKPGFFSKGGLQYPSNVTRLSRSFRKHCSDHTTQVVYYQAGVGTGTTLSDSITGGAFGVGVAEVSFSMCPAPVKTEDHSSRHRVPTLTPHAAHPRGVLLPVRQL